MKYKITEAQLSKIIAESTNKILAESLKTEGGWANFKQGLRDFDYNFRRGLNGQGYDGSRYGRLNGQTGGNANNGQAQTLEKLQAEIDQIKQQISALEGGSNQTQQQTTPQQPQATPQQPQATPQQPQAATQQPQAAPQQPQNKTAKKPKATARKTRTTKTNNNTATV